MADEKPSQKPFQKKRAPTLYFIIAAKLAKGLLALGLAFGVYHLRDKDLPDLFRRLVEFLRFNPESEFFHDLADKIGRITPANVLKVGLGILLYSFFSLVEGVGLIFRMPWAGWLAIGESAFFIPIEISHIVRTGYSWKIGGILGLNVLIVWYLLQNRERLFRHHH